MTRDELIETMARASIADLGLGAKFDAAERYNRIATVQLSSADFCGMMEAALSALEARGMAIAPKEPTPEMCESGEDVVAEILKDESVALGVRCGCGECDAAAWAKVTAVYRAMLSAFLTETKAP